MGTYGIMSMDSEIRCDYEKLRRDRLEKTRATMKAMGIGSLLVFEQDHIRYITGTKIGEWNHTIRNRYVLLCEGHDPILFENGSAIAAKRLLSPFQKDIRPCGGDFRGVMDPACGSIKRACQEIYDILREWNLQDAPLGVDDPFFSWIKGLQDLGLQIVDGHQCMLQAERQKTEEEIYLTEMAAACVDAGFYEVLQAAKPGVREIELAAIMRSTCLKLGCENVMNAQVTSGNRGFPHPHDVTDRFLRPGDIIYMDVVADFMGYKTCYYRTLCCGKPTENQNFVYNKCYDIVKKSIDMAKAGVEARDFLPLYPKATELGYKSEKEGFLLQMIHGIGITHWAKPLIAPGYSEDFSEPLLENEIVAFENYYAKDGDAARIEVEGVIRKDHTQVITQFPADKLLSSWDW